MRPATPVFLIELRDSGRPIGLYLHVCDEIATGDTEIVWSRDNAHALRFSTKRLADQHIQDELDFDAVAVLVDPVDILPAPDGRDCGCTSGFICRHNLACPRMARGESER